MNMKTQMLFLGIDIQTVRPCAFACLDTNGAMIDSGWFQDDPVPEILRMIQSYEKKNLHVSVGIDAPRMPMPAKRAWYWNGIKRQWRPRRSIEKGNGRHCEVVISAHGLARPQWTPLERNARAWMKLGFKIFSALENNLQVYEVFPSASYALLSGNRDVKVTMDFSSFAPGPKDAIDACMAAITVCEYCQGKGLAVGNGDGLGSIILPRSLGEKLIEEVMKWPDR